MNEHEEVKKMLTDNDWIKEMRRRCIMWGYTNLGLCLMNCAVIYVDGRPFTKLLNGSLAVLCLYTAWKNFKEGDHE